MDRYPELKIDFSEITQSLLAASLEASQAFKDFADELSSVSVFLRELTSQFAGLKLHELSLTDEQSFELESIADSLDSSAISQETRQVVREDIKKKKISFENVKAWFEFIAAVLGILGALGILTPEKAQECFYGFQSTVQEYFISAPDSPIAEPPEIQFPPEARQHL